MKASVQYGLSLLAGVLVGGYCTSLLVGLHLKSTPVAVEEVPKEAVVVATATYLKIPRLQITAPFGAPLGLTETGEHEVPKDGLTVGWYMYGPKPGEVGPAVVLGHVDTWRGPAVFKRLNEIVVGDQIFVETETGEVIEFEVFEIQQYRQDSFDTKRVYQDVTGREVRLITCDGVFNSKTKRYSHNLVVFARAKES